MSQSNGDKARYNKNRKRKAQIRVKSKLVREVLQAAAKVNVRPGQ